MTSDAEAEYERVRAKYPPARRRDLVVFVVVIGLLAVASAFRQIDWPLVLGGVVGLAVWEVTKLRLRRNARNFAQPPWA